MKWFLFPHKLLTVVVTLVLVFSIMGCGSPSKKTPPKLSWTAQLGTFLNEEGHEVAVDGSGNVFVTGYTSGGLDGNMSAGNNDIFLVKYNSTGVKQWTRQLGTSDSDYGEGVAVDGNGNIFLTGWTNGGLDGNTNAGSFDIFLVKYDSAGVKQWTRQLGTSGIDWGKGVAVDGVGNIFVTGFTAGGLGGYTNAGSYDIILLKYDSSGNMQWTRQLGTSDAEAGEGVAVDGSGNIFVTGFTLGGLDGNTAGSDDIFLVKYNSTGVKQWTRQLGTSGIDYGTGVAVDGGGNVFVTGYTDGGLDGNTNAGESDIFLVKYDSAGSKQWTKQLGTSVDDAGNGVAVYGNGNVFVAGSTSGGLDGNTNAGPDDIFLVKYNSAGTKQWTRQLGTSSNDFSGGVAVDSGGNIFVTGSTDGGLNGNINAGEYDMLLVKYD